MIAKKHIFFLKVVTVSIVLMYLIYKVATANVIELFKELKLINPKLLIISVFLVIINWGLEAKKWQLLLKGIKNVSFINALKSVLSGLSSGLLTPNRLGNFIGRLAYLDKKNHNQATVNTLIGNLAQFVVTVLMGLIGLFILFYFKFELQYSFWIIFTALVLSIFGLMVYYKTTRINIKPLNRFFSETTKKSIVQVSEVGLFLKNRILLLSLIRYLVFSIQYFLLFKSFGLNLSNLYLMALIFSVFLITTLIPSLLFGKLFVRESVALFIFSIANVNASLIIVVAFLLWCINLAIPAVLGSLFWLKQKEYA